MYYMNQIYPPHALSEIVYVGFFPLKDSVV